MDRASPQTVSSHECRFYRSLLEILVIHGKAVARRLDTCPLWQACLAHWPEHPKLPAWIFPGRFCACQTRRVATSSRPVPKITGGRGEVLFRPTRIAHLPWREQEN